MSPDRPAISRWRLVVGPVAASMALLPGTLLAACTPKSAPALLPVPASTSASWRPAWAVALGNEGSYSATNSTCRMFGKATVGGGQVRLRLTNRPNPGPVTFDHVTVALRGAGHDIDPTTVHDVTVGGQRSFTVAGGTSAWTDPVSLSVSPGSDVAVSLYFSRAGQPVAWHLWPAESDACTASNAGDLTASASGSPFTLLSPVRWVDAIQVSPPSTRSDATLAASTSTAAASAAVPVFAAYGDSLTDGLWMAPDSLSRWTDRVAVAAAGRYAVLNLGNSGDRITGQGQPYPARFTTDVLDEPGLRVVYLGIGSNDLAAGVPAVNVLASLNAAANAVRQAGGDVIVGTVPPRPDLTAGEETQRQLLNASLRTWPHVLDLDRLVADPAVPTRLAAAYDVGDHYHLSPSGHQVVAAAIEPLIDALLPASARAAAAPVPSTSPSASPSPSAPDAATASATPSSAPVIDTATTPPAATATDSASSTSAPSEAATPTP